jgi:hypothetical protein|tara:strand:+ start:1440 stop:1955 length:516 start_codon:yes stop_codon:yes gene_type:complete
MGLDFNGGVDQDFPAKILQVVRAVKTNQANFSSSSTHDVPGLDPAITPQSTNSKILIMTDVAIAVSSGGTRVGARVVRRVGGSDTVLDQGDASGSKTRTQWASHVTILNGFMHRANILLLDSPNTTSQVQYKFQIQRIDGNTVRINRGYNEADSSSHGLPISSVVLMEVHG